jgi:lipopolysaccharide transport system ATP-binding protein
METVASEGRTVLFVSHNLTAVSKLCNRAMLLQRGQKIVEGPTARVIEEYSHIARKDSAVELSERTDRHGSGRLRFTEVGFEDAARTPINPTTGEDVDIVLRYRAAEGRPLRNVSFAISVSTILGELMLHLDSVTAGIPISSAPADGEVRCHVPRLPLPAGRYLLNVFAEAGGEQLDWVQRACEMTVDEGDFFSSGQRSLESHATVLVDHAWAVAASGE